MSESVCGKIPHPSKHTARLAARGVGNTFRVYICTDCAAWHVTKERTTPFDPYRAERTKRTRRIRKDAS